MKKFHDINTQINILTNNHQLIIDDSIREAATQDLKNYGYHEIVNGYQDAFMQSDRDSQIFDDNTSFAELAHLFRFDVFVRSSIRYSADLFEITFKTALSYFVAEHYGVTEDDYLKINNFRAGRRNAKGISSRDWLFNEIEKKKCDVDDDLIQHHINKDPSNIPPWILIKSLNFGAAKQFFMLLNNVEIKNKITYRLISSDFIEKYGLPEAKELLIDLVNLMQLFRNRTSHSNRTFDYYPKGRNVGIKNFSHIIQIQKNIISDNDLSIRNYNRGIGAVISGLSTLNNDEPFKVLIKNINTALQGLFPENDEDNSQLLFMFIIKSMHLPAHFDSESDSIIVGSF